MASCVTATHRVANGRRSVNYRSRAYLERVERRGENRSRFSMAGERVSAFLMTVAKGYLKFVLRIHRLVPASQMLQIGQPCLPVEQVVAEYAVQIVIHEQGTIG